jgi:predicted acylesterase/phospholipase RssA
MEQVGVAVDAEQHFSGMRAKTTYFADTTLLLAGGGFGASAFAGAYLAAESRGCRFHAVAATSSGAIVAALIASGCRGRELVKAMRAMSRAGLMGHDPVAYDTGGERRIESAQLSSENIQHWLDDRLRAKLGVDRPVIFADLPRLLIIMALDLQPRDRSHDAGGARGALRLLRSVRLCAR